MEDQFHRNVSKYSLRSSNDLLVPRVNQTTFGLRRHEGAVMWNHLPEHIKTAKNIGTFKKLRRNWKGPQCKRAHCKYANEKHRSFPDHIFTTFLYFIFILMPGA